MLCPCDLAAIIMKNQEIAELFSRMGTLLEIKGENVFKIRAYHTAAENILNLSEDVAILRQQNRLDEISGIGEALQQKIGEYLDTGHMAAYETLITEIPETLLDVMSVPSVGPKKAKLFFSEFKISDVAALKAAAQSGKLSGLPGIQAKTVENILNGIALVEQKQERMDLATAFQTAETVIRRLKKMPEVKEIVAAGSLRRMKESVLDIDILVDSTRPAKVMEAFVHGPDVKEIYSHGETKSSVLTEKNVQVDLRVVEPKCFGAALLHFTGSKEFNVRLRQLAIDQEKKVSEYGIFSVKDGQEKFLAGRTEQECFKVFGFPYIPPELREELGAEEIFKAGKNFKVPHLVELKSIKGDLHVHSTYSDGRSTIAEMAEAARKRGYEYVAISDHSQNLKVADGLSPADVLKKKKEIDKLNMKYKNFRILLGTETEIDNDGNLDYNDKILSQFDVVIAAVHSGFEQDAKTITRRLVKACRNKYVHVIAHPTCGHFVKRASIDVDLTELCKAAADNRVGLEINSFPVRLDLNSAKAYFAKSLGTKLVVNTDAHHTEHLDFMQFGVAIARRAWLTKKDVLNTLSLKDLLKALEK